MVSQYFELVSPVRCSPRSGDLFGLRELVGRPDRPGECIDFMQIPDIGFQIESYLMARWGFVSRGLSLDKI